VPFEWTPILKEACDQAGIDYFSSPYDFEATDMLDPFVPAYKIGSGDITWLEACCAWRKKASRALATAPLQLARSNARSKPSWQSTQPDFNAVQH
jgi:sialic acid synthase SpsE